MSAVQGDIDLAMQAVIWPLLCRASPAPCSPYFCGTLAFLLSAGGGAAPGTGLTVTESRSALLLRAGAVSAAMLAPAGAASVFGRLDNETCDIAALRSTSVSITSKTATYCLS